MRGFWIKAWLLAAALISGSAVSAQAIQQSGPVTGYHVGSWASNGYQLDGGSPDAPAVNALGIFGGSNCPVGISSQTSPGVSVLPYSELTICQSPTTTTFKVQGVNGQATPNVQFDIGGLIYPFPGASGGNVNGPNSSALGDLTCWNNNSGTLLIDCQNYAHGNAGVLVGSETILGVQSGTQVKITPAQLSAYTLTAPTATGPYNGQVAQPLYNGLQPSCVNLISYMTPTQQAQVLAGTATFDTTPMLQKAWNAVAANHVSNVATSHPICLPPGRMQIHTTWVPAGVAHLIGAGGNGLGNFSYGSLFVVDPGIGFLTLNTTASSGTGALDAGGSIFEGFAVMTAGDATDTTDGILIHARSMWRDITVGGFSHDQIHVVACAGCGGSIEGNANNMYMQGISLDGNPTLVSQTGHLGINGLEIEGADTNGGLFQNLNEGNLRGWCDRDNAFLQNVHVAEQCAGAGIAARVNRSGVSYFAVPETTSAALAANDPATSPTQWTPTSFNAGYPTWSGGGVYYPGGGFDFPGSSQRIAATGLYDESGSPPSYAQQFSIINGGLLANGITGAGAFLFGNGGFFTSTRPFQYTQTVGSDAQSITIGDGNSPAIGQFLTLGSSTFGSSWVLYDAGKDIYERYGNAANNIFGIRTGLNTSGAEFGRTGAFPMAVGYANLLIGDGNASGINFANWRAMVNSTALPSSTGRARGEISWNRTPSVGGPAGWIEITQGTPDTWQPFGVVGGTAVLSGTSGSIGGGALLAGACSNTTVSISGLTTAMAIVTTPTAYPGDGFFWHAYASSANTATVSVCAAVAGTPSASTYNLRVLQ